MTKKWVVGVLVGTAVVLSVVHPAAHATGEAFTGTDTYTGSRDDHIPISGVQVSGTGDDEITVNIFVPSGSLALATTTGLTFDGPTSGTNLHITGTRSDINTALATMTFTPAKTADVKIQLTIDGLANAIYDPVSHHVYQDVHNAWHNWNNAKTAAEAATFQGISGYLATITSSDEQLVVNRLGQGGWLGGSDAANEGEWNWVSGPDDGQNFWNGGPDGAVVDGMYAQWAEGFPDNYTGSNPAGENCLEMRDATSSFAWNDQNCDGGVVSDYFVEYGSGVETPALTYKDVDVHVTAGRDLNDDGTEDADQPKVADIFLGSGKWAAVVLNFDCRFTQSEAIDEVSFDAQDADYDYPGGLLDFTATCSFSSFDTQAKIYFYDEQAADIQLRKYNPNTHEYFDMASYLNSLQDQTIDGHNVAVATYHITSENGLNTYSGSDGDTIADPVGIALAVTPPGGGGSGPSDDGGPEADVSIQHSSTLPRAGQTEGMTLIGILAAVAAAGAFARSLYRQRHKV